MKTFAQLFKKYRLRAEFETIASFSSALAEEGYFYEESTFSHWQKGTRIPSERNLVLTLVKIFIRRKAIKTIDEVNEFLSSAGLGFLTNDEIKKIGIEIDSQHFFKKTQNLFFRVVVFVVIAILLTGSFLYVTSSLHQENYVNVLGMVPSENTLPKKLVIGIDATLPPMEYIQNAQLVGFDVDLGNDLAKELHADIEFKNIPFDSIFNALDQKQINMIVSAVTITKVRQNKYDFSEGYLHAGQVVIIKKDNTTIRGVQDLKGKRIATQAGTTNEQEALLYTSDNLVLRYPDFDQATKALVNGQADAIFTDLPNAKGIISQYPTLMIAGKPFTKDYYGIVFIKGDSSVIEINQALTSLRKKGVLNTLEKKWLNNYD